MPSSIAISAGPLATPYHRSPKRTSNSANSSSLTSPSLAPPSAGKDKALHTRRPSLVGSAISVQEWTVINIGDPDGPPWLVCCQGFAWNPEIFVPSYVDCDYVPSEHRRDPAHAIFLSDEESKNLLPR
ncbi:hypothetical protein B0J15DRAFT_400851 [Fusarium solani]|uniref:Uncharacterized protein n=1 Tax=Fusarium solani TaxID=169388 RepID=A0A9P9H154_FUSSL|nr:uncharacterized protein B0J15DRAFT_400851 [Fusarium solani]KAH7248453.1 hypothetical protein B0J15DRAFT_400851 [Fusarium solani]